MNNFFKTKTKNCVDKWFVGLRDCFTISSWLFANLIHHAHELLFCNPHALSGASREEGLVGVLGGGPSKSTDKP